MFFISAIFSLTWFPPPTIETTGNCVMSGLRPSWCCRWNRYRSRRKGVFATSSATFSITVAEEFSIPFWVLGKIINFGSFANDTFPRCCSIVRCCALTWGEINLCFVLFLYLSIFSLSVFEVIEIISNPVLSRIRGAVSSGSIS